MKYLSIILLASMTISSTLAAQSRGKYRPVRGQQYQDTNPFLDAQRHAVKELIAARQQLGDLKIRLTKSEQHRAEVILAKDRLFEKRDRLQHAIRKQKALISDLELRHHELHDAIDSIEQRRRHHRGRNDLERVFTKIGNLAFGDRDRRRGRGQVKSLRRELADVECRLDLERARYDKLCSRIVRVRKECAAQDHQLHDLDRRIGKLTRRYQDAECALKIAQAEIRKRSIALTNFQKRQGHRRGLRDQQKRGAERRAKLVNRRGHRRDR